MLVLIVLLVAGASLGLVFAFYRRRRARIATLEQHFKAFLDEVDGIRQERRL